MKDINSVESLIVPEGVTVDIKARTVSVEGPRGKLTKKVGHIQIDIQLVSVIFVLSSRIFGCRFGFLSEQACWRISWEDEKRQRKGNKGRLDEVYQSVEKSGTKEFCP